MEGTNQTEGKDPIGALTQEVGYLKDELNGLDTYMREVFVGIYDPKKPNLNYAEIAEELSKALKDAGELKNLGLNIGHICKTMKNIQNEINAVNSSLSGLSREQGEKYNAVAREINALGDNYKSAIEVISKLVTEESQLNTYIRNIFPEGTTTDLFTNVKSICQMLPQYKDVIVQEVKSVSDKVTSLEESVEGWNDKQVSKDTVAKMNADGLYGTKQISDVAKKLAGKGDGANGDGTAKYDHDEFMSTLAVTAAFGSGQNMPAAIRAIAMDDSALLNVDYARKNGDKLPENFDRLLKAIREGDSGDNGEKASE